MGDRSGETTALLGMDGFVVLGPAPRQIIESATDTLKGQLDLERHGGHTWRGVVTRVLQRLLALTAAIWHKGRLSRDPVRSLLAYDH